MNTKNYIELKSLGLITLSKTEDSQICSYQKRFDSLTGKQVSPEVTIISLKELESDKASFIEEKNKLIAEKEERVTQINQIIFDVKAIMM